jgi:hypothetical protein
MMSLTELLPDINLLSRVEKQRLMQLLAQDLAEHETDALILANRSYPVWSPHDAFSAAETMLESLP